MDPYRHLHLSHTLLLRSLTRPDYAKGESVGFFRSWSFRMDSKNCWYDKGFELTDIRNDIFPRMIPFLTSRDKTISAYIDEAFEAVPSLFSSKEKFIEYVNSLDTYQTAELFIKICKFFLIAKKYQPTSYVKLIMVISAIERVIYKDRRYEEFHNWIEGQDAKIEEELQKVEKADKRDFVHIIRILKEEYFKAYSSRRNINDFFQNHVSNENKIRLIRSFRANWTKVIERFCLKMYQPILKPFPKTIEEAGQKLNQKIENGLMPYCYDWHECYVEGWCGSAFTCALANGRSILEKTLKKVVDDIYQMRNDFVHEARITPLNEKDSVGTLAVIGADRRPISIELTATELETIFENGLKHYFDCFVK